MAHNTLFSPFLLSLAPIDGARDHFVFQFIFIVIMAMIISYFIMKASKKSKSFLYWLTLSTGLTGVGVLVYGIWRLI